MADYVRRLVGMSAGTWVLLGRHASEREIGVSTLVRMIVLEWLSKEVLRGAGRTE